MREDCDDQFCPDPLATQLLAMQPIGQCRDVLNEGAHICDDG